MAIRIYKSLTSIAIAILLYSYNATRVSNVRACPTLYSPAYYS